MSDMKSRLEEVKRRAAAKKAEAEAARLQAQAPPEPVAPVVVAVAQAPSAVTSDDPLPFEMVAPPQTFLVPTPGVALNYRGDPSHTHTTARSLARSFLSGGQKRRRAEEGSVRLGPSATSQLANLGDRYTLQRELGKGAYGTVTEAKVTGGTSGDADLRAVKEVQEVFTKESQVGYPPHLLREFDAVMRLNHPNILRGVELGKSDSSCSVYLVTDHGGVNLMDFLFSPKAYMHLSSRNAHPLAPNAVLSKIKCVAKQLLTGLAFLHEHCMLHRDLKTANILVDGKGVLRICDFGLARYFREGDLLTPGVVTLMYRAPEVHFGIPDYGAAVDVWSAGCILAELFLKAPLFPANQELEHFKKVCEVLGVPDDVNAFPGMLQLPAAMQLMQGLRTQGAKFRQYDPTNTNHLKSLFSGHQWYRGARECVSDDFIDLLSKMLRWNPKDRPSAAEALRHPWFSASPLACAPDELHAALPTSLVGAVAGLEVQLSGADDADEAEACAGKQDLDVQSVNHDQKRQLLNKGGDEALVMDAAGGTTPPDHG